ncbi:hypothetical protein IWQ60_005792 [Tieghemiomyces parasiticus]|uniref:Uncharacterized protein n=1 Tax=Tieghemiomyces parasiticus TaxID=78921 RepID=A0A9W8DUA7_9FUNG|nr:hypothetical protein IWQ60_005792 [Tieghemiomyces parasiticus]
MKFQVAALFLVALAVQNQHTLASSQYNDQVSNLYGAPPSRPVNEGFNPDYPNKGVDQGVNTLDDFQNNGPPLDPQSAMPNTELGAEALGETPKSSDNSKGLWSSVASKVTARFPKGTEEGKFFKNYCQPILTGKQRSLFARVTYSANSAVSRVVGNPAPKKSSLEVAAEYLVDALYRARRGKKSGDVVAGENGFPKLPGSIYWIPPPTVFSSPEVAEPGQMKHYQDAAKAGGKKSPIFLVPTAPEDYEANYKPSFAADVQLVMGICHGDDKYPTIGAANTDSVGNSGPPNNLYNGYPQQDDLLTPTDYQNGDSYPPLGYQNSDGYRPTEDQSSSYYDQSNVGGKQPYRDLPPSANYQNAPYEHQG